MGTKIISYSAFQEHVWASAVVIHLAKIIFLDKLTDLLTDLLTG